MPTIISAELLVDESKNLIRVEQGTEVPAGEKVSRTRMNLQGFFKVVGESLSRAERLLGRGY